MMAAMPGPFSGSGYPIKDFTATMDETGIPRYNITLLLQERDFRYSSGDPMATLRQKAADAIKSAASRYNYSIGEIVITDMQVVSEGNNLVTVRATGVVTGVMYQIPETETIKIDSVKLYNSAMKKLGLLNPNEGFAEFDGEAKKISEQILQALDVPPEMLDPNLPRLKSMVLENELKVRRNIVLSPESK